MTEPSAVEQYSSHEQIVKELHAACKANELARVRDIFKTKLLSAADATHALKDASRYKSEDASPHNSLVHFLLEHGADPNVLKIRSVRSLDMLKLLAEFGYDIQTQGHLILQDFTDSREILDWLLDHGVDINRTDCTRLDGGFNLCEGAYDSSLKVLNRVAARGDIQLFDHLVTRGADPWRSLALHCTSKCKDPQRTAAMISHLVDKHCLDVNADTDAFNNFLHDRPDSGTPLNCAVYRQNLPAIQELLKKGACPTNARRSPVHHAIGNIMFLDGYLPALRPLLNAGADSTVALDFAVSEDNVKAARICLKCGANPVRALEQEQARVNKAATEQDVDSEEEKGMSDEMRKLLEDWKPVDKNALSTRV